jgi:hypothetical protein
MPKYVQLEIDQARRDSKSPVSAEVGNSSGISRETILQYLNDADQHMQDALIERCPDITLFHRTATYGLVAAQQAYVMPVDCWAGANVVKVEYSYNGEAKYYEPLRPIDLFEMNNYEGVPSFYCLQGSNLLLDPTPSASQGTIRLTYNRQIDGLDVRRGTIDGTTNDGTNYTSIVLATDSVLDESLFDSYDYLCVSNADGTVTYYNVPYTTYATATKTFTLGAGVLLSAGTIAAGSYVTLGKYTTTHSPLPRSCDRYRLTWGTLLLSGHKQSSKEVSDDKRLTVIEDAVVSAFKRRSDGPYGIPIINNDYT